MARSSRLQGGEINELYQRKNHPTAEIECAVQGCIYLGVPKSKSQLVKGKKTKARTEFTNADILFVLEMVRPRVTLYHDPY